MKYYFGHVTTQYMGMEWGQDFVMSAQDNESVEWKANKEDWTHGNGIEEQEEASIQEISEAHFLVLKEYIMILE